MTLYSLIYHTLKMSTLFLKHHSIRKILIIFSITVVAISMLPATKQAYKVNDWEKTAAKYEKEGNFDAARQVYAEASGNLLREKKYPEYIKSLTGLSLLQKSNFEFKAALLTIQKADSAYRKANLNTPLLLGEIKHQYGTLMIIFSDNPAAVKLLEQSILEKRKVLDDHDTLLASTYNNLGMANSNLNRFDDAIKNINLAVTCLTKKKENKLNLLTKFHENLGITFARMGDYSKAREYLFSSLTEKLKLVRTRSDTLNLASSYINLGQIETTLSNLDSAFSYLNTAEKLLLSTSNSESSDIDIVYNNKGNVYSLQGDYEKALAYYNKSLIMLRRKSPGHGRIKEIQMNIGHIYFVSGEYEKSAGFFRACIAEDPFADANIKTYRNLGRSLEALGQFQEAGDYFRKAIEISVKKYGKNHNEVSASHLHYGNFLNLTGNLNEALTHYKTALQIYLQLFGEKNRDVADCYMRLAELELKRGNDQEGLQHYQRALIALVEDFNNPNPQTNPANSLQSPDYYLMNVFAGKGAAFFALYKKNKQQKDLYLSYNNYRIYASVVNKIRNNLTSEESNLAISGRLRDLLSGALRTTTELFNVTSDDYYLAEAFSFAERGKSAILLAELNGKEELLNSQIPTQSKQEAQTLRNNIAGYKKLIYEEQKTSVPNHPKIDLWREKVFALEKKQEELTLKIKEANPDYLKYRFGEKIQTPGELQPMLQGETILEYTLTNDAIYAFVISQDTFVLNITPIDPQFNTLVSDYAKNIRYGLLADPQQSFKEFISYSQQLYDILIKPHHKYLKTKKLLIIPDGILGYIPFETLLKAKPNYKSPDYKNLDYLIKGYSIRYSYLATLPFMKRPFRENAQKAFGGFAPIYRNNVRQSAMDSIAARPILNDIPGIRTEVQEIAHDLARAEVFLNDDATETTFKKVSGKFDVLHLALHTLVDNENPMFSKFIFSNSSDSTDDQLLNAYEVYNLNMAARLAVLSSCNTGVGQLISGEGVMSLARGFLYAGVPSVVMTLWEAEDEDATGMMPVFYENLKQGQDIDLALHLAKLNYLSTADRLRSHPYFWSAYVMIGANEPIESLTNDIPVTLIYSVVAFLILLAALITLRIKSRKSNHRRLLF